MLRKYCAKNESINCCGKNRQSGFSTVRIVDNFFDADQFVHENGKNQGFTRLFLWITLWIMWKSGCPEIMLLWKEKRDERGVFDIKREF